MLQMGTNIMVNQVNTPIQRVPTQFQNIGILCLQNFFVNDRLQPTIILSDYEIILNILIVYRLNIKCIFIYIV
jgi:hypothetical protein